MVRLSCFAAFIAFALAASVVRAGESSADTAPWSMPGWKPTQVQIDRLLGNLILCEPVGAGVPAQSDAEGAAVLAYMEKNIFAKSSNEGVIRIDFSLMGVRFTEMNAVIGPSAWSPTGSAIVLANALSARGFHFTTENVDSGRGQTQPVLISKKINTDEKQQVMLLNGKLLGKENSQEGFSVMCVHEAVTEDEVQAALGLPSTKRLWRMLSTKEKVPKEVVGQVILRGGPDAVQALTSYAWLDSDQVTALMSSKLPGVRVGLLKNMKTTLSTQQIDAIIRGAEMGDLLVLIAKRYAALTAEQRRELERKPETAPYMTLKAGGAGAVELLARRIKDVDAEQFARLLPFLPTLTPEVVDLILSSGTLAMRRNLTMNSAFDYSDEQKERILQDSDPDVQIGLLRRKDVRLTDAQVARGINHRDPKLSFWYQRIDSYTPTAEQIEIGLTAADSPTRYGWAQDKRVSLTPKQVQRGLADSSANVVGGFLLRSDIALTEANFDACTAHPDIFVRFACVSRADYTLTQKRFAQMVGDENSNVLRSFLQRKGVPPVDLDPFVREAFRHAPEDLLLAMAANRALPLTKEQIQNIPSAAMTSRVMQAFSRRMSEHD
jgi:hypothetical protein